MCCQPLGHRRGFEPPDPGRPGRLPRQQGICEPLVSRQDHVLPVLSNLNPKRGMRLQPHSRSSALSLQQRGARSSAAAALALVLALGLLAAAAEGDPAGGAADGVEGQTEEDEDDIIAIQVLPSGRPRFSTQVDGRVSYPLALCRRGRVLEALALRGGQGGPDEEDLAGDDGPAGTLPRRRVQAV